MPTSQLTLRVSVESDYSRSIDFLVMISSSFAFLTGPVRALCFRCSQFQREFDVDKFSIYGQIVDTPDSSALALAPVTPANTPLPGGICRGLLVGTAGTANIIDGAGNSLTGVPLQQGYNPIQVRQVGTGGTASNIWALY